YPSVRMLFRSVGKCEVSQYESTGGFSIFSNISLHSHRDHTHKEGLGVAVSKVLSIVLDS
ncbi:hypothetical protein CEXT_156871, partial [Caerostris extrusa]